MSGMGPGRGSVNYAPPEDRPKQMDPLEKRLREIERRLDQLENLAKQEKDKDERAENLAKSRRG